MSRTEETCPDSARNSHHGDHPLGQSTLEMYIAVGVLNMARFLRFRPIFDAGLWKSGRYVGGRELVWIDLLVGRHLGVRSDAVSLQPSMSLYVCAPSPPSTKEQCGVDLPVARPTHGEFAVPPFRRTQSTNHRRDAKNGTKA